VRVQTPPPLSKMHTCSWDIFDKVETKVKSELSSTFHKKLVYILKLKNNFFKFNSNFNTKRIKKRYTYCINASTKVVDTTN
jgi:hypothetical protein